MLYIDENGQTRYLPDNYAFGLGIGKWINKVGDKISDVAAKVDQKVFSKVYAIPLAALGATTQIIAGAGKGVSGLVSDPEKLMQLAQTFGPMLAGMPPNMPLSLPNGKPALLDGNGNPFTAGDLANAMQQQGLSVPQYAAGTYSIPQPDPSAYSSLPKPTEKTDAEKQQQPKPTEKTDAEKQQQLIMYVGIALVVAVVGFILYKKM